MEIVAPEPNEENQAGFVRAIAEELRRRGYRSVSDRQSGAVIEAARSLALEFSESDGVT